jgi:outer membrane protein TolC
MIRALTRPMLIVAGAMLALAGCSRFGVRSQPFCPAADESQIAPVTSIDLPDADTELTAGEVGVPAPLSLGSDPDKPPAPWELRLEDAVQLALANNQVMRELGVSVLRSPGSVRTVHDPAIQESDPRFGVEAALAAFDATFSAGIFGEKNDRKLNNAFLGGGTRELQQDLATYRAELSKRSAVGTEFTLRHNSDYDANNAPANLFDHAWNMNVEAEIRQPLLHGAGLDFNRIAGPGTIPGQYNGVLVARTNTDISLAEFETGVRNLTSDVENAYWDLYFAYRDLDAKVSARDAALSTWRQINAWNVAQRKGGEADKEALAREQYYRLQEEVQNALSGRLVDGTRANNGSGGGTFRGTGGVHTSERRLRLLLGLPINDGRLIRPSDEPPLASVVFDWDFALAEALERRVELRRQKWLIKRRELECVASENFTLPKLDAVGRYRWRGFGRNLLRYDSDFGDNAVRDLFGGDFQEWLVGAEFTVPLGNRKGFAAMRNAELQLARERAILREQEREVTLELSNMLAEKDRAYAVLQTNFNRRAAAKHELAALLAAFENENAPLHLLLDAQRRVADAESQYARAIVEYALAVKNVHFEKGSLLDYNGVYLSEGAWPRKACLDAAAIRAREARVSRLAAVMVESTMAVSRGVYPQDIDDGGPDPEYSVPATRQSAPSNGVAVPPASPPAESPAAQLPSEATPVRRSSAASEESAAVPDIAPAPPAIEEDSP